MKLFAGRLWNIFFQVKLLLVFHKNVGDTIMKHIFVGQNIREPVNYSSFDQ